MRSDVGAIPLMCLLSTLTSTAFGYLPNEDLTNSIIPSGGYPSPGGETIIPTDGDEDLIPSPDEDTDPETSDLYRNKKVSTFRRRNINAPFGGRVPFSRMAYKAGYGANRMGLSRNGFYGHHNNNNNNNPYGTLNLGGGGGGYGMLPEEYNIRPSAPFSGLIGGSRAANGYYGSTVAMRRGQAMRKSKVPNNNNEYPSDYTTSNDLMSSFNTIQNPPIPSLRELATYASRYGPAYLRERFGGAPPPSPHDPSGQMPRGGGGGGGGIPIDFNMNIASNQWNHPMKRIGVPLGIMSRDVDSYQHDDATSKATPTKATPTKATPTKGKKGKKARKPVKKTSTTTTISPKKSSE